MNTMRTNNYEVAKEAKLTNSDMVLCRQGNRDWQVIQYAKGTAVMTKQMAFTSYNAAVEFFEQAEMNNA